MEGAALIPPPDWLERIVLITIPPHAREVVAGDLWETCRSPRQYASEALRTVPFVIASQMRRNVNLPALMLQVALAWMLLGAGAAAILMPVLMLRDAYRPVSRPSSIRAIRETMVVALLAMIFVQSMSINIDLMRHLGLNRPAWLSLYFFGFLVAPLLCFLRTGLIVGSDRRPLAAPDEQSAQELACDYRAFARRARRRNLLETGALAGAALAMLWHATAALVILFALAALYLLVHGAVAIQPRHADFTALRALYQRELDRQQQLRRFLWWLWFTPLLVALHDRLIQNGLAAGKPILAALGAAFAVLLCFLVTALNGEGSGRAQEEIGALDRLRERAA